jgi:hypothetical protein
MCRPYITLVTLHIKRVPVTFPTEKRGNQYNGKKTLLCIRYSTIETKEGTRIGYNGFQFQYEYTDEGRGA